MMAKNLPSISVLIPTLNAARVLDECLKSVIQQDYPKEKLEIVVADGGSTDETLNIIRKFQIDAIKDRYSRSTGSNYKLQIKIFANPLKTGEAGKAVALRKAKGELVVLIDSDNVLPGQTWFRQMVEPFSDLEIIGSEPWEFAYRKEDGFIDRYCALLGMNDPLCYFGGNYDKKSVLTGKWTDLPVEQEDKGGWIKATLKIGAIPTIGANGTIFRRSDLLRGRTSQGTGDYLFDIDIVAQLVSHQPVKFAKVKTGIIHLYCGSSVGKFIRKQQRRIKDYLYYQQIGARTYPWHRQKKTGLLKFIFSCVTILPLFWQAFSGYLKKPDPAWFFHPVACMITLWLYSWETILVKFYLKPLDRRQWRQ